MKAALLLPHPWCHPSPQLLPKLNLHTVPTAVDESEIVIDTVKVTVLYRREPLQEPDSHVGCFGQSELLADANAGSAIELLVMSVCI